MHFKTINQKYYFRWPLCQHFLKQIRILRYWWFYNRIYIADSKMPSCFLSQSSQSRCLAVTADDGLFPAQLHSFHIIFTRPDDDGVLGSTSTPPRSNAFCSELCCSLIGWSWSSESWFFGFWSVALLSFKSFPRIVHVLGFNWISFILPCYPIYPVAVSGTVSFLSEA